MPRTMAPLIAGVRLSIASVSRNGAAPMSPGAPFELLEFARASRRSLHRGHVKVACADRLSNRVRSSVPKPFMTESTVISASTPSATPSNETQVMKETKKLCSRASEYRRPTKTGTGWNIRGD